VDTALLAQLNDFDPTVRKQAIIALGRSKDAAALPYLATVVRTDPEPELRELARKAGQYIQQNAAASPPATPTASAPKPAPPVKPLSTTTPPPPAPPAKPAVADDEPLGYLSRPYSAYEEEDNEALAALGLAAGLEGLTTGDPAAAKAEATSGTPSKVPVRGKTYVVSAADKERAKDILESALSANMNNDNARAMRYLYQALMTDPNLINDDYYAKIASGVTNLGRDDAIQMVVDQGERKSFIKTQQKAIRNERKEKHLDVARRSSWNSVLLDVLIFLLINTLGPLVIFLAISEFLNNMDPTFADTLSSSGVAFTGLSLTFLLPVVCLSAGSSVASLFVMAGIIHVAATLLLRGVGTFTFLLTQLLRLYNRYLLIIYGLSFISVVLFFVTQASPLFLCATIPITLVSLFLLFKTFTVVGNVYDFGLLMGCLAVAVAYVVLGVIGTAVSVLLANTVLNAMMPMMMQGFPSP
jgi:hypothetical protein